MFELLRKTELENGSKSNHEYQIFMDNFKLEELKKVKSKINLDNITKKTAQDFEDASLKELAILDSPIGRPKPIELKTLSQLKDV